MSDIQVPFYRDRPMEVSAESLNRYRYYGIPGNPGIGFWVAEVDRTMSPGTYHANFVVGRKFLLVSLVTQMVEEYARLANVNLVELPAPHEVFAAIITPQNTPAMHFLAFFNDPRGKPLTISPEQGNPGFLRGLLGGS